MIYPMDGFGNDFSLAFASLVAIINPLGLAFVFRRLTIWATPSERAKLSTRIALYAVAVILGSYFFGRPTALAASASKYSVVPKGLAYSSKKLLTLSIES